MKGLKRLMALLLCMLMLTEYPVAASAAEGDGTFYLTALKKTATVIEPVAVSYKAGQTVREALLNSGYRFEGLDDGFVTSIEGVAGNYNRYYDGGGYDLEYPASGITAFCFTEEEKYSPEMISLIVCMGDFNARKDNVQKYEPAAKAYKAALIGMRNADAKKAKELQADLEKAIAQYEAVLAGKKFTVSASALQAGTAVNGPEISLEDIYGNVTKGKGGVQVIAGTYKFTVSDGGWNRTEGKLEVKADTKIKVELPSGEWFGDIKLLRMDRTPYTGSQDNSKHTAKIQLPDTVGEKGIYLNVGIGNVPDREKTKLRTIYVGVDGRDQSETSRSWESTTTALAYMVSPGLKGRKFPLEARYTGSDGYTMIQSYDLDIVRVPTLTELKVESEGTVLPMSFDPETEKYTVAAVSDEVTVSGSAFAEKNCTVEGLGKVKLSSANTDHTVKVIGDNGQSRTYTVTIQKKKSVSVKVENPAGTESVVLNSAGYSIAPVGGVYHLVPGEEYVCRATKAVYFHSLKRFTASEGLVVRAAAPETVDAMEDFAGYNRSNSSMRDEYAASPEFRPSVHEFSMTVPDSNAAFYLQSTLREGYKAEASYLAQTTDGNHGTPYARDITMKVSPTGGCTYLPKSVCKSGYSQNVKMRVSREEAGVTYEQDYTLLLKRSEHLDSLEISDQNGIVPLRDKTGNTCSFDRYNTSYNITVDRSRTQLQLKGSFMNESDTSPACGGYYAMINGTRYNDIKAVEIPLNTEENKEIISIDICHEDKNAVSTNYSIEVKKTDPVLVRAQITPQDATVFLTDNQTGRRVFDKDGVFSLTPGGSYSYTVTRTGYVGVENASYTAPDRNGVIEVTLAQAPGGNLQELPAAWPSFRADDCNNGVVSAPTPQKAEDTMLSWATKLGDGYSADACGCPIIVNGYIYVYAQSTIYKVDTVSGKIAATGNMDHSSSFAINPPTYAAGMIFVGLADGTVQAFNADTLESLWIYRDEHKGQPNCPIVYHDGYIYTGFWLGETTSANYVCISVTDEDPSQSMEEKIPTWTYTSKGGFYWAGAYVNDNYLVVGTDDGAAGYTTGKASILSFDPKTGRVIDKCPLPYTGDMRSSVTFVPDAQDSMSGTGYFTTKGGYFYGVDISTDGHFVSGSLDALPLYNYSSDPSNPAMSTSTPTVYNGRAYVGVSGISQFGAYSGHNITVIDIPSWSIAYTVRTQGYPQTSGLLTTAYEKETGCANIYFLDNYTPGKLRMLKDRPGQTAPSETVVESYTTKGETVTYDTGYVLFTPNGEQAQYALCSPIVDEYGNIFLKNDSSYLMCISNTIKKLEITAMPDKTEYKEGDVFDGKGMKISAIYSNGEVRDVTEYVKWSEKPLTKDDTNFQIIFPHVMYQNKDGKAGVACPEPSVVLSLKIGEGLLGDCNGDGYVNAVDAAIIYAYVNGRRELPKDAKADINNDGYINAVDAAILYAYVNGKMDKLPGAK